LLFQSEMVLTAIIGEHIPDPDWDGSNSHSRRAHPRPRPHSSSCCCPSPQMDSPCAFGSRHNSAKTTGGGGSKIHCIRSMSSQQQYKHAPGGQEVSLGAAACMHVPGCSLVQLGRGAWPT